MTHRSRWVLDDRLAAGLRPYNDLRTSARDVGQVGLCQVVRPSNLVEIVKDPQSLRGLHSSLAV